MKLILCIIILLFVGCDNPFEPEITFLNIQLDSERDSNGYYHIDYNGTTYNKLFYILQRVGQWTTTILFKFRSHW